MAKKKVGRKRVQDKALTELERVELMTNIEVLTSKVARRQAECDELEEALVEYTIRYEKERNEKVEIIKELMNIIQDVRNTQSCTKDTLNDLLLEQEKDQQDLEADISALHIAREAISEHYSKKIENINAKVKELEDFRSRIPNMNETISETEAKIEELRKERQERIERKQSDSQKLLAPIRRMVIPHLNEKADVFQKQCSDEVDQRYVDVVLESKKIEDVLNIIHNISLGDKNIELAAHVRSQQEKHHSVEKMCKEKAQELQDQYREIMRLEKILAEGECASNLLAEVQNKLEDVRKTKLRAENALSRITERMEILKRNIENKEGAITTEEKLLFDENKTFKDLQRIVIGVRNFMKDEMMLLSNDAEEIPLLEKLHKLLALPVDDIPDLNSSYQWTPEKENKMRHYTKGDLGILFRKTPAPKTSMKKKREHRVKKEAVVQTEEAFVLDMVTAKMLSEIGLLSKFQRINEKSNLKGEKR